MGSGLPFTIICLVPSWCQDREWDLIFPSLLYVWLLAGVRIYRDCVCCAQLFQSYSLRPTDCSLPGSFLCPWNSSGRNTGVGCHALLQVGDLSNPGIKSTSPTLAGGFFTAELLGELLQWLIFAKMRGFGLFLVWFCLGFIRTQSLTPCGLRSETDFCSQWA